MSALSGVTANSAWNFVKKLPNEYGHFVFGTHGEQFGNNLRAAVKKDGYGDIFNKVKTAYQGATATRPDSLVQATKENTVGLWKDLGKSLGSQTPGIWNKTKGVFKALSSKMPLLGNALMLGFEIPNIIRSFTEGSVGDGAIETAKTTVKLGGWAAGAALGQALIPIPFLGAVVGGFAANMLMTPVMGKSFSEKQDEKNEKMVAQQQGAYQSLAANQLAQSASSQQAGSKGVNKYGIPYANYFVEGDHENNYKPQNSPYNSDSSNIFDYSS